MHLAHIGLMFASMRAEEPLAEAGLVLLGERLQKAAKEVKPAAKGAAPEVDQARLTTLAKMAEVRETNSRWLATVPFGEEIGVEWITSLQDWAIGPVLDAGLSLMVDGAVFVRGDVGPFRPYLPSGAYL